MDDVCRSEARMIKAVIFDLDGVMVDSEPFSHKAWQNLLDVYGKAFEQGEYAQMIGQEIRASAEYIRKEKGLPISIEEILAHHYQERLRIALAEAEPAKGLNQLIRALEERAIKLAVASNSPMDYVMRLLDMLGLRDHFNCVVAIDHVCKGKPEPDIYRLAAFRMGLEPESCLVIEDSPVGMQAALAAGMRCVVVPDQNLDGRDFDAAYARFPSLEEIHDHIDQILQ
jgi:HAD superfamily hydrolase (TIGR01509 family)